VTDADPNREGFQDSRSQTARRKHAGQKKNGRAHRGFYKAALPVIAKEKPAERFSDARHRAQPHIPLFEIVILLKPACLAVYPMYKGLAQLVGMKKSKGRRPLPNNRALPD